MRLGRAGLAGLATAGALVVAAGVSWACTPQASVVTSPGTASAGGTVTVTAGSFYSGAGYGAVEVRWDGDGGVLLASAPGPSFSLQVQVPNAPPGVYSVVALQKDAQGAVAGTASTAFTVSDPATTTPTESQPSSTSGTSATTTSRTRQAPTSGSPPPATADAEPASSPEAGATTPAEGAPTTGASPAPATSSTPSASTASSPVTASSPRTAARATSAGASPLASASTAPAPASPLAPVAVEEPEAPGVSARTAGADLWSGLARGSSPTRGASLDVPPPRHDRAPAAAAALSLAVAAASALALGATRRRRAVVTASQ